MRRKRMTRVIGFKLTNSSAICTKTIKVISHPWMLATKVSSPLKCSSILNLCIKIISSPWTRWLMTLLTRVLLSTASNFTTILYFLAVQPYSRASTKDCKSNCKGDWISSAKSRMKNSDPLTRRLIFLAQSSKTSFNVTLCGLEAQFWAPKTISPRSVRRERCTKSMVPRFADTMPSSNHEG